MDQRRYIDVPLLQEQEAYCNYVRESFTHLDTAYRAWDRSEGGRNTALLHSPEAFNNNAACAA
jgi:hypothetical protein